MDAIDLCFKQQTNGMCITYWDALLFKEGVKDFKDVDVEEEDVSEAEALQAVLTLQLYSNSTANFPIVRRLRNSCAVATPAMG